MEAGLMVGQVGTVMISILLTAQAVGAAGVVQFLGMLATAGSMEAVAREEALVAAA